MTSKTKATDKQKESTDARARSIANLKPFKPSQSGNPAGRPPGKPSAANKAATGAANASGGASAKKKGKK
jgi:hypothetical protein